MKKIAVILAVVLVVMVAAACVILLTPRAGHVPAALSETYAPTPAPEPAVETEPPTPTPEPTPTPTPYISPIDFDGLKEKNPDIYAWITIPETNIDYAVLQSAEDDAFYLDHDEDGNYSINGSVFSESYFNAADFTTDPVVLLYGHHMASGAIFGYLQRYYTDAEFLALDEPILIYTESAEYEYRVFAAVRYSDVHILDANDMTDDEVFAAFIDEIAAIDEDDASFFPQYAPEPGDHVVILSTCYSPDNHYRYIVLAARKG